MKQEAVFINLEGSVVEVVLVEEKRRWFDRRWEQEAIKHIERRLKQRRSDENSTSTR